MSTFPIIDRAPIRTTLPYGFLISRICVSTGVLILEDAPFISDISIIDASSIAHFESHLREEARARDRSPPVDSSNSGVGYISQPIGHTEPSLVDTHDCSQTTAPK